MVNYMGIHVNKTQIAVNYPLIVVVKIHMEY